MEFINAAPGFADLARDFIVADMARALIISAIMLGALLRII